MSYNLTINKYGKVYAEHYGAWYPVQCDVCSHFRLQHPYADKIAPELREKPHCAQRDGIALIDRWYFHMNGVNPFDEKPKDCESFTL